MKKLKILFWNIKTPIKTLFNNSKINDIQLVRGLLSNIQSRCSLTVHFTYGIDNVKIK